MNLYIPEKINDNDHLVLLGKRDSDFAGFIRDESQLNYLKERLKKEKDFIFLNAFNRMVIVQILKDGQFPLSKKMEDARKAAFRVQGVLNENDVETVIIHNAGALSEEVLAFAEGLALSNYQFLKYLTKPGESRFKLKSAGIVDEKIDTSIVERLNNTVKGVYLARDLVNEPLSYLTAVKLSEEIEKIGKDSGFSVEIFNKKKIESLKMGGLLGVNKGSLDPPTFSILTWKPEGTVNSHPIILVGKGVVFDTGGLSLKPTQDSMDYMKCDMAGAAAVAGIMYSIASSRLPVWVIGLVPATDNRPDGNAYVPGDVITMYNGTTVEVLNTDAEGRMILADALSYAKQYDPELVIELSTLTGAAHAAVDKYGIVGMGTSGREIMDNLKESGDNSYERIVEFPLWEEYGEMLKSDVADLKNIGGKYAGAITAGKFLEHFTDYPFIHLDIAGPAFNKLPFNYRGKGGSGVGVRLLFDFLYHRTQ